MMTTQNSFTSAPTPAAQPETNAVAIVILRGADGKSAQRHYTGKNLPRIGEQLDIDVNGVRSFVTVQTVRHPQAGLPVIYAAEGESLVESIAAVQMGVATIISRLDELERRFQEATAPKIQIRTPASSRHTRQA